MAGVVLGFIALIWVATRPSQSPEARMLGPASASSQEGLPFVEDRPRSVASEPEPPRSTQPETPSPAGREAAVDVSSILDHVPASQPEVDPPNEPDTARYEQDEKITTTRFHIVQRGETLSGISQQYYGSASRWQRILQANQDTITDANRISPGTKLVIPD